MLTFLKIQFFVTKIVEKLVNMKNCNLFLFHFVSLVEIYIKKLQISI